MPAEPIVAPSRSGRSYVVRGRWRNGVGEKLRPHSAEWFLFEVDQ